MHRRDDRARPGSPRTRTTCTCRRSASGASCSPARRRLRAPATLPARLRYLTLAEVPRLFEFSADMQRVAVEPNRLNTQVLVRYYEEEWDG